MALSELAKGRKFYEKREWSNAYESLSQADQQAELNAEDLELLASAAYMLGQEDNYLKILERSHQAYLNADQPRDAARCAFWLGLNLLFRGEASRGTGWLSSAKRLIERYGDCVEKGYLLLPKAEQLLGANDCGASFDLAGDAAEIGSQFDDIDLIACARHIQGRALMQQGSISEGITLLDEVMVPVTSARLSPIMTGLIYCSVIEACQQVYAYGRAQEWTTALMKWCEQQPQLIAFTGRCLVHRAEIMHLYGDWLKAIEEAERACERLSDSRSQRISATAIYQQGEIYRLRGEFGESERAYEQASRLGYDPQPGLALLRLAQGRKDVAVASIRRVVEATADKLERAKFLPAYVEIMLAYGDIENGRRGSHELQEISQIYETDVLIAMAVHSQGAVELAEGETSAALGSLRKALDLWQQLGIPYLAARVRILLGMACRDAGDEEGGHLELEAARAQLSELGAVPDINKIDSILGTTSSENATSLTERELQVLSLVAAGKTNKAIASALCLSQKTVDRHLSNIFTKLDVPSRAAATAYAYKHKLL